MRLPSILSLGLLCLLQGCVTIPRHVRHADPLTPEQHVQLGGAYETRGLTDDARKQYAAAVRADAGHVPALMAQGNLAFGRNDLKEARACFQKVLRVDPNHAAANNNLAMVLLAQGRKLPEAERLARRALENGGALRPYVLETLASVLLRQGRGAEVLPLLDEAEALLPPGDGPLRRQLAATRAQASAAP